jgi:hypothetical protein
MGAAPVPCPPQKFSPPTLDVTSSNSDNRPSESEAVTSGHVMLKTSRE